MKFFNSPRTPPPSIVFSWRGKGRKILVFRVVETQKHEEHVYSSFLSHTPPPPPPPLVDTMELNLVGTFICINSPSTNRETGRVREEEDPKGRQQSHVLGPMVLYCFSSSPARYWSTGRDSRSMDSHQDKEDECSIQIFQPGIIINYPRKRRRREFSLEFVSSSQAAALLPCAVISSSVRPPAVAPFVSIRLGGVGEEESESVPPRESRIRSLSQ